MKYRAHKDIRTGYWYVKDLQTGERVIDGESYTIADQFECYLNGYGPGVAGEVREAGDAILNARA